MSQKPKAREKILEALRKHGTLTPKEIAQHTGLNHNTVRGVVQRLAKKGLIKKTGRGKYSLP